MRRIPTDTDYSAEDEACEDLMRANRLAAGIVFASAGVPFMLSGEGIRPHQARRLRFVQQSSRVEPAGLAPGATHGRFGRPLRRADPTAARQPGLLRRRSHDRAARRRDRGVPRRRRLRAINPTGSPQTQLATDLEMPDPYGEVSKIAPNEWQCIYCFRQRHAGRGGTATLPLPSVHLHRLAPQSWLTAMLRSRRRELSGNAGPGVVDEADTVPTVDAGVFRSIRHSGGYPYR